MSTAELPPIPTAAQRLRLARHVGWLFTTQPETALRDRWGRECGNAKRLIVHMIASPHGWAGIRANGCTVDRLFGPAGRAIVEAIATEHGGRVRWHGRDDLIDVSRLSPEGATVLIWRILDLDLWFSAQEVR